MRLEKIMNTVYSFAAAIVIFGAWAKLEHKEYGSLALTAGLLTETAIFFLYGLIEWRSTPETSNPTSTTRESSAPSSSPPVPPAVRYTIPDDAATAELTTTLKQTNRILNKVFRAD